MVEIEESFKVHLIGKSAEHIEPLNLAFKQLECLHEWMSGANAWMSEKERVYETVTNFHPDKKYDPSTRVLVHEAHSSGLWLEWEGCNFDPSKLKHWTRVGIEKGADNLATFGKFDHRELGLVRHSAARGF